MPPFFMLSRDFYIFSYIVTGLMHRTQLNIRSSHSVSGFRFPNRQEFAQNDATRPVDCELKGCA